MGKKQDRLSLIETCIRSDAVSTQEQLCEVVQRRGLAVTQSTLSRDLAELGIRKVAGLYVAPQPPQLGDGTRDCASVVIRMTVCGPHLIVIHTAVGQGQAVAVAIDKVREPSIEATLAGDDTVFVATRSRRAQQVALRRLKHWFGNKCTETAFAMHPALTDRPQVNAKRQAKS